MQVNPRTYIGSGKVQEIMSAVANTGATTVIFDDELSPGESRKSVVPLLTSRCSWSNASPLCSVTAS